MSYKFLDEGLYYKRCVPYLDSMQDYEYWVDSLGERNIENDVLQHLPMESMCKHSSEINLSSFVIILENIDEIIPQLSIHDYKQFCAFIRVFLDNNLSKDSHGYLTYTIPDTLENFVDICSSKIHPLVTVFYNGMDFLPFSTFDKNNNDRISIPASIIEYAYKENNKKQNVFKALIGVEKEKMDELTEIRTSDNFDLYKSKEIYDQMCTQTITEKVLATSNKRR